MEGRKPSSDTGWNLQASTVPLPQSLNHGIIEVGGDLWMSNLLIIIFISFTVALGCSEPCPFKFSVSFGTRIPQPLCALFQFFIVLSVKSFFAYVPTRISCALDVVSQMLNRDE